MFFFVVFFILAESGRGRRSIAEKEDRSNSTIVPFLTSDDSRRDHKSLENVCNAAASRQLPLGKLFIYEARESNKLLFLCIPT